MVINMNNRTLSLLGQNGTFGLTIDNLAKDNNRIFVLSADLIRASGLDRFSSDFPDRLLNVGIAEQNAVGMASGMADNGAIPFVVSFSNFTTLRANEFIRHFMAYMQCNVKIIGLSSGFSMGLFGNTHYGIEDVAAIRSMSNITILSPSDCLETVKCIEYAASHEGPVYVRLSGKINNPIVYKDECNLICGKANELKLGDDIAIFATGSMVDVALKVSNRLEEKSISASVYDFHTIKPIDIETIVNNINKKRIISIEEHSLIGGLGSAVSEILSGFEKHGKHLAFGIAEGYKAAGSYEYMLKTHGLTPEVISNCILNDIV